MSRLIKKPIPVPNGVQVEIKENIIKVKGPKGELSQEYLPYVKIEQKEDGIWVTPNEEMVRRQSDRRKLAMFSGTYWALVRNMIIGVTQGYQKELEIKGVGYRAQLQGKKLVLNLGYAHPVEIEPPEGITIEVPNPTSIIVKGMTSILWDRLLQTSDAGENQSFTPVRVSDTRVNMSEPRSVRKSDR